MLRGLRRGSYVTERPPSETDACLQLNKAAPTSWPWSTNADERFDILNPEDNPNHAPRQRFPFKHGVSRWTCGTIRPFMVGGARIDL
ncbi:Uncharacterised protein [Mycobacteroides abscessus subsp. abscessus]|nr:Uncharacterised protein [Mycobacteroides abscessus subsp. abscessus]